MLLSYNVCSLLLLIVMQISISVCFVADRWVHIIRWIWRWTESLHCRKVNGTALLLNALVWYVFSCLFSVLILRYSEWQKWVIDNFTLHYLQGRWLRLDRHPVLRPQHGPNAQPKPLRSFSKLQEEKPMDISQRIQRENVISENILSQKH